jgi:hypothetical protein
MAQCIACEFGRNYIGKTGKPVAKWLREFEQDIEEDLLEKSKLVQHIHKGKDRRKLGFGELKVTAGTQNAKN